MRGYMYDRIHIIRIHNYRFVKKVTEESEHTWFFSCINPCRKLCVFILFLSPTILTI
ncbi:hypothetical protein C1H46_013088 [Malus baccata]|uniref:Uncharacterized protein n=1 Tax=Malus baccata TaxID=106549 RepID=A0A540MRB5_MALBA|nr:hypothetical protein C1H46_013088 [Malus baccata]